MLLHMQPGRFRSALAAAPTVLDGIIFSSKAAVSPRTCSTTGLSWSAGQPLITIYGTVAGTDVSSFAGDGNDTFSSLGATTNTPTLALHQATVNGSLDANFVYTLTASSSACGFFIVLSSASTIVTPVLNTGAANVSLPQCSAVSISGVKNRLALAIAHVRGAHVTNPPTAPSGYALVTAGGFTNPDDSNGGVNGAASTIRSTIAIAQATFNNSNTSIAAADWGGLSDAVTNSQPWSTAHIVVEPA